MSFLSKLFLSKSSSKKLAQITIYLDSDCRRNIQTHNQTIQTYIKDNQFEQNQYLYISIKSRKNGQIILKRKLNLHENLSDVLLSNTSQQYKVYIIVGYNSQRNTIPKINSVLSLTETLKFIRSGTLQKYSQSHNSFQECQLKLHHDYLTYYKLRSKQKKVSFMPLENATVEMIDQKRKIFTVKDKFKSIMFKTTSKQDMIGWLLAISQAIRVRNAQIYMNQLDDKMNKRMKDKLNLYCNRCSKVKDSGRNMLLDQIGRIALKQYFKSMAVGGSGVGNNEANVNMSMNINVSTNVSNLRNSIQKQSSSLNSTIIANTIPQTNLQDIKMLNLIQIYLYMCKIRREKGQQQSQKLLKSIKQCLQQLNQKLPQNIRNRNFNNKNDLIKSIEEIMRYLDDKYKRVLVQKKYLFHVFQGYMGQQYRNNSRIQVGTLYGNVQGNKSVME